MLEILRYNFYDIVKSRWLAGYAFLFFIIPSGFFFFSQDAEKTLASLLNIVTLLVPLASISFAVLYFYNSRKFIELLLTQPIPRHHVFFGAYCGTTAPLMLAFVTGMGASFLAHASILSGEAGNATMLMLSGILLTFSFTAIGFFVATLCADRIKGFGMAMAVWIYLSFIHDGVILAVSIFFSDYPVEKALLALSFFSPVVLARILMLMRLDIAALMGLTGAIFKLFLGGRLGAGLAFLAFLLWIVLPLLVGLQKFNGKDFT